MGFNIVACGRRFSVRALIITTGDTCISDEEGDELEDTDAGDEDEDEDDFFAIAATVQDEGGIEDEDDGTVADIDEDIWDEDGEDDTDDVDDDGAMLE